MPVVDVERPLYVHGLGHFHPENVIDNRFLEDLDIGTNEAWIVERVGIHTRRTVLPLDYIRETRNADVRMGQEAALYTNAETGRRAAMHALDRTGLSPKDIGMVIAGGCCPALQIPAEACSIAAALGIEAPAIDLNSACSSFGAQVHFLASMTTLPPYVLVINPENTTRVVSYADRTSAVLWGDGTSAAIVSKSVPSKVRVVSTTLDSSPAGFDTVKIPRFSHFMQNGNQVQRFAIKTTQTCLGEILPGARERAQRLAGRVRFIGHQANMLVLESVARKAELTDDEHWHNVGTFGNTAASGAPTVLSQHWDDIRPADTILVVVVGSGLTWSSIRMDVDA
jgi:3-oxoacyl-[acyl-carrier-protein] synthase III